MVEPKPITSIFSHIRGRTGRTQKRVNFEVHEDLLYFLRFLPAIPSASIFSPSSAPQSHPSHSVTPPVHPVTPLVHPVNPCITLKHPLLHPVTILLTLFTLVHSVTPSYPLLNPVTPYDISATPCYTRCTPSNTPISPCNILLHPCYILLHPYYTLAGVLHPYICILVLHRSSSFPQNGLHGFQIGLTGQVHLVVFTFNVADLSITICSCP